MTDSEVKRFLAIVLFLSNLWGQTKKGTARVPLCVVQDPHLSDIPQDLAPLLTLAISRLSGFTGPVPPPLLIRYINACPVSFPKNTEQVLRKIYQRAVFRQSRCSCHMDRKMLPFLLYPKIRAVSRENRNFRREFQWKNREKWQSAKCGRQNMLKFSESAEK